MPRIVLSEGIKSGTAWLELDAAEKDSKKWVSLDCEFKSTCDN